jgi:hypothetical protein
LIADGELGGGWAKVWGRLLLLLLLLLLLHFERVQRRRGQFRKCIDFAVLQRAHCLLPVTGKLRGVRLGYERRRDGSVLRLLWRRRLGLRLGRWLGIPLPW